MNRLYLFAVAALLLPLSCQKETDIVLENASGLDPERITTFYASVEETSPDTKVYADESLRLLWNADDRISIFNKSTYNFQFVFTGEDGDNAGGFDEIPPSGFISGNSLDNVYAVYPYASGNKINNAGSIITLSLPAEQAYREHSFGVGANTMVAATDGSFLAFKNVGGYLVLRLYGDDVSVSRVTLQGNNGEKIAGKAKVSVGINQLPSVTMDGAATESVSVVCDPPVQIGNSATDYTEFWFVLPPVTFTQGFTITVEDALGGSFVKSTSKSFTITRSTRESMSALKVAINYDSTPVSFADANFKAYCVANFDTNGDGEISVFEARAVTDIDVCTDNITTLEGIKAFSNLKTLYATGSEVTYSSTKALSLTGNTSSMAPALGTSVATGQLTSVDLIGLSRLESLDLSRNKLTALDVSNNTVLTSLACDSNQLTSLDVSNNPSLESLQCQDNPDLSELWLETGQEIPALDYDSSVTTIYYNDNVSFDDANFKAYCVQNFDTDGDGEISSSEALAVTRINVADHNITSLGGIEAFSNLTYLNCSKNQLTVLDVSNNTALRTLNCSKNQLAVLDVSINTELRTLNCSSNQLTALDVSKNTALTGLNCSSNQLTELDVSQNAALTQLLCTSNQLTTLDVSNNTALTRLECQSNQLTELDVSQNAALTQLSCGSNQLTTLDVSQNTALQVLFCYSNQLTALDVNNNTALEGLISTSNQLTVLDVSKNTALTVLACDSNQLTTLDVSNNTALQELLCSSNQLTSLDVSYNIALRVLACTDNPNLAELWLETGQEISTLEYDSQITTIYYKEMTLVTFDDANFKAYCVENFDVNSDGEISVSEARAVTDINVRGHNITSLRGIEAFAT